MSRLLHIKRCCFWCHWDLRDIWLHICVMLCHRWLSGQINSMCGCHERMRNHEESVHVIGCTLSRHKTNMPRCCKIVRVMHPPVLNIFKWQPGTRSLWRNGLNISKLSHHPLWSLCDHNGTPSKLTGKTWNQIKLPNSSVLTIWHPTNIRNHQSIYTFPVYRCW